MLSHATGVQIFCLLNATMPFKIIDNAMLSSSHQSLKMISKMSTAVIFLKCLLLIASPIFITATDSCAKNETDEKCLSNYRLPPGVLPIHYDIRLKLYTHDDVEKTTFGGETNITIKILYGTQYISLHSLKLEINQLKTKLIYENGTIYTPIEHRHRVPHVLVLYFTNTLLPGFYTLCFKYMGYFSEKGQGFLKIPDRKIHNKMKDLMVLSHFKKTPLMSTHLLGIAVIEVGRCNNDSIFHIWCRQNVPMDFVHNLTQQYRTVANHLIRYTKTIMKLPKLDIIIVPDNVPNNSSSWGMLLLNQFGSATPDDFWDTMQTVLNEANIKFKHFEIKEVMHIWLNQTTYPMVQVRRKYEISETTISHYDGYYRVNYDAKNWEKIADCLDSDEFTKIHVMNRAQLIDDAYYFLVEKHLDFHIFLQITSYLSKEVDYIAWLPMFRILSYQWKFFLLPFGEPAVLYALRVQILDSLNGLVRNIGYEDDSADDGITKLMRGTALTWACTYGDLLCEKRAVYKLSQRIDNLEQYTSYSRTATYEFFKQKDAEMSKYLTKIIPMRLTQLQNMMTTYLQRFM
ncbi:hypothetical protein DMN91_003613 [Ooceraea biroi]|uniref:Uncharacterized protein n=1 Tax=Ooceraea biroi TaxID=2015173 RepID=A0A3L8DU29_OOCBI|nr:hypothetical protein DMN91_003613 [Ooceraea biroi]